MILHHSKHARLIRNVNNNKKPRFNLKTITICPNVLTNARIMNRNATRSNNETITNEDIRRKMADHTEFGSRKTIIVLAIVAGCFAILWPKIFYPMISSPVNTIHTPIDGPGEFYMILFQFYIYRKRIRTSYL